MEHHHGPAFDRPGLAERIDLVTLQRDRTGRLHRPKWQPIPKAAVERLISEPQEPART